jgi:gamma-glutamyltranspeptidase/glutathione hydrolase
MSAGDRPRSGNLQPLTQGYRGAVVAGHPAAALVGLDVLRSGGNAIDAGVATGLAMNVLLSNECSFLGVAPTLVHLADGGEVVNFDGTGVWPQAISLDRFDGGADASRATAILHTVTPGTPDAWMTALSRFGTRSFAESAAPAIALAEHGFPMYPYLHAVLSTQPTNYRRWPGSAAVYFPRGEAPLVGERFVQADLARTLREVADAERRAAGAGRETALRAARDFVYKGELARRYVDYCRAEGGVLTLDDMAEYEGQDETPSTVNYRGVDVYCTGLWGQGPVLPQALGILAGYDLGTMGHNSASYAHAVSQALDLAFSDRETHMGDPRFTGETLAPLLSEEYLSLRRTLIDADRAWPEMPPPGDPVGMHAVLGPSRSVTDPPTAQPLHGRSATGTAFAGVIDADGNIFSCIMSDGARSCPVVPGLGVVLSSRGNQCKLEPGHPAAPAPGKRPRLTPAPALVLEDGRASMALGGFGGDMIPQAVLQIFLAAFEFGLDPQAAVEAPRFYSSNFPSSSVVPTYLPGTLQVEARVDEQVLDALAAKGHTIERLPAWWEQGACLYGLIRVQPDTGLLQAGADPRGGTFALAY